MGHLLDQIKIVRGSSARLLGGGTQMHGIPVNMAGFEGALFLLLGSTAFACEATTHIRMRIKGTNTSSTQFASTGFKWLTTGAANMAQTTEITAGQNFRIMAIDVYKPEYQFLKASVSGATGGFNLLTLLYGPRRLGSTELNDSTYIAAYKKLTSPSTYDTT